MPSSSFTNDCPVSTGRYFGTKAMLRGEFSTYRRERALLVLVELRESLAHAIGVCGEDALDELRAFGAQADRHRTAVVHQPPARDQSFPLERGGHLRRVRLRP